MTTTTTTTIETRCDICGRLRGEHDEGWHMLSWVSSPPTSYLEDGPGPIVIWAKGVGTPSPKDLCSWKCVRDYSGQRYIEEEGAS